MVTIKDRFDIRSNPAVDPSLVAYRWRFKGGTLNDLSPLCAIPLYPYRGAGRMKRNPYLRYIFTKKGNFLKYNALQKYLHCPSRCKVVKRVCSKDVKDVHNR